jgi:D-alanyl-D-alanine carboxypeptidase/D-alanyl-D-alanine-endopeptidase (penicillin-binding protein 4)
MNLDQNLLTAKKSPEDLDPYVIEKVHRVLKRLNIMGRVRVEHDSNKIPESKILVNTVQSKTLKEIMPPALKKSDNFVFDCLYLKIVSLYSPSPIKKWEEGDAIIKKLLRQHFNINIGKALIVDGSGLSRYNRIQPQKLYELLCKACKEQEFIDTLPRPLEPSTMLQQRANLPKTIKAKTGSMSGISGLCGYNFEKSKGAKVFVMFASNFTPPLSEVYVIQDQFIRRFC